MKTIVGFGYEKGAPACLKQGIKGNRTPKGAVAGGNGTFIVCGDPPKVPVYLADEEGERTSVNMYGAIKDNSSRRMSENYVNTVMSDAVGAQINGDNPTAEILALISKNLT